MRLLPNKTTECDNIIFLTSHVSIYLKINNVENTLQSKPRLNIAPNK